MNKVIVLYKLNQNTDKVTEVTLYNNKRLRAPLKTLTFGHLQVSNRSIIAKT